MWRDDPNREFLLAVAGALGDLCDEVVFVGGSVAGLLLTDPVAEGIRATKDVDAVVEATTLSQYYQVEKRLPALGFTRDVGSEVICRWRHAPDPCSSRPYRGGGNDSEDPCGCLNVEVRIPKTHHARQWHA
jgi:hypothetical protein